MKAFAVILFRYIIAVIFTPSFPNREIFVERLYFRYTSVITKILPISSVMIACFAVITSFASSAATIA